MYSGSLRGRSPGAGFVAGGHGRHRQSSRMPCLSLPVAFLIDLDVTRPLPLEFDPNAILQAGSRRLAPVPSDKRSLVNRFPPLKVSKQPHEEG